MEMLKIHPVASLFKKEYKCYLYIMKTIDESFIYLWMLFFDERKEYMKTLKLT